MIINTHTRPHESENKVYNTYIGSESLTTFSFLEKSIKNLTVMLSDDNYSSLIDSYTNGWHIYQ